MSIEAQISKSIGAHGLWKQRILSAIDTGKSDWTPDVVRQDCNCDFGKWLGSADAEVKVSPHYAKVKGLHSDFHKVAASVLEMALAGRKEEATAAVGSSSEYANISTNLTREMMDWKKNAN